MASIEDLKKMHALKNLNDEMLDKILSITQLAEFNEADVVFDEGEKADSLYMLKRGKVILEAKISETVSISLDSIKPGYSFGWTPLLGDSTYPTRALCVESSEVLVLPTESFLDLLNKDNIMDRMVMKATAVILQNRLEKRTTQFLKVMAKHPDIEILSEQ